MSQTRYVGLETRPLEPRVLAATILGRVRKPPGIEGEHWQPRPRVDQALIGRVEKIEHGGAPRAKAISQALAERSYRYADPAMYVEDVRAIGAALAVRDRYPKPLVIARLPVALETGRLDRLRASSPVIAPLPEVNQARIAIREGIKRERFNPGRIIGKRMAAPPSVRLCTCGHGYDTHLKTVSAAKAQPGMANIVPGYGYHNCTWSDCPCEKFRLKKGARR